MCPSAAMSCLSHPTFLLHFHVHIDVGHVIWISLPLFFEVCYALAFINRSCWFIHQLVVLGFFSLENGNQKREVN